MNWRERTMLNHHLFGLLTLINIFQRASRERVSEHGNSGEKETFKPLYTYLYPLSPEPETRKETQYWKPSFMNGVRQLCRY